MGLNACAGRDRRLTGSPSGARRSGAPALRRALRGSLGSAPSRNAAARGERGGGGATREPPPRRGRPGTGPRAGRDPRGGERSRTRRGRGGSDAGGQRRAEIKAPRLPPSHPFSLVTFFFFFFPPSSPSKGTAAAAAAPEQPRRGRRRHEPAAAAVGPRRRRLSADPGLPGPPSVPAALGAAAAAMSAQSLLSSVFSCSSPAAAAAPAAAKSLSKRRLRQTRSLDPAIIGGGREEGEGAGRAPRARAAGSPPGQPRAPRGSSASTPSSPLERSPPGSALFDGGSPRGKRSPGREPPFLPRAPSASALSGPAAANSIFSSPRRWLQQRKGQPSPPGSRPAAYVVRKSEVGPPRRDPRPPRGAAPRASSPRESAAPSGWERRGARLERPP